MLPNKVEDACSPTVLGNVRYGSNIPTVQQQLKTSFQLLLSEELFVYSMSSPYVEPPGPPEHWNVKQNKYWMASRNLSKQGNAKDLRERVYSYMNQDGGPPPVADVSHVSNRRTKREMDPTDTEDPSAVSTDEKVSAVSE